MATDRGSRAEQEQEFEDFAVAVTPQLYRAAWLLCGDRHEAEDLVQETLAKVFVRWSRRLGRRIDNPAAYARSTLTNTFLSSRRRRSSTERPYADLPDAAVADETDLSDLRSVLRDALADLSPPDRVVLVLRHLYGLSVDEAAQRMGVSAGAVRSRSSRALDRLRATTDLSPAVWKEQP